MRCNYCKVSRFSFSYRRKTMRASSRVCSQTFGGVRIVDKSGTLLATYYKGVSTFGDRTQVMVVKQKPAHEDNQTQPEKPDSV